MADGLGMPSAMDDTEIPKMAHVKSVKFHDDEDIGSSEEDDDAKMAMAPLGLDDLSGLGGLGGPDMIKMDRSDGMLSSDGSTLSDDDEEDDDDDESSGSDYNHGLSQGLNGLTSAAAWSLQCRQIGRVLYENSWTGEMMASSTDFSRREFNALLDVVGVPTDSVISCLVWRIIFYSQRKTHDDLVNEEQTHTRWLWFHADCEANCLWKWRKYSVVICQWLSLILHRFIAQNQHREEVPFSECEEALQQKHAQTNKKGKDEREEEKASSSEVKKNGKGKGKGKKVSIDAYFGKHSKYSHCVVMERQSKGDVRVWHRISDSDIEYLREVRCEQQLFGVRRELRVDVYHPNPSPFAIPPQLAGVEQ